MDRTKGIVLVASAVASAWAVGCQPAVRTLDPCGGIACAGHGTCFAWGSQGFCACEEGYHPLRLACVEDDPLDPCADVTCNGHGACVDEGGSPACDCDDGFVSPPAAPLLCLHDLPADASTDADGPDVPDTCGDGALDPGEDCDDGGNGDPDDGCTDACAFSCTAPADCDDGLGCTDDDCDLATHVCMHEILARGEVCRSSAEACDPEETCDGESADCPPDGTSCWLEVSAGGDQTCAIADDHTLWCWGYNYHGALGTGDNVPSNVPVRVGTDSDWRHVSAGFYHTCAVRETDELYCWGKNDVGQVGDGTTEDRNAPVPIGAGAAWHSVSAGDSHTCAVETLGNASCWGSNDDGQLGDGTLTRRLTPTAVGGGLGWRAVSTGWKHTCAQNFSDDTVSCWGNNEDGQLGDGTTARSTVPVQVVDLFDVALVHAGGLHACAIPPDRKLFCWGDNAGGELGIGTRGDDRLTPVQIGTAATWMTVDGGFFMTCGIMQAGEAYCWGSNGNGQLGIGVTEEAYSPTPIAREGPWAAVSSGFNHCCAVRQDGTLYCWGLGQLGQLGNGADNDSFVPVLVLRT